MIDGVFPSQRTEDESGADGLEEERRLAYVAFTRAKKHLYISTNSAYSFVLQHESTTSRFIDEAGLRVKPKGLYQPKPRPSFSDFGYYPDEPRPTAISQLDAPPKPTDNGIRDWRIGDVAIHDVFGRGIVTNIIDGTILQIDFETHGRKSILASHPKVRKEEKGVKA